MIGTKLVFFGEENFYPQAKFGSDWRGMKVIFLAFSSSSVVQPGFPPLSSLIVEKPKHYIVKLTKTAFIGQETERKQHRHNSS